ncbi:MULTISPECIES: hypothetical protein [unclassified Neptuniibacter]|uniref:hypothetical protein n=1 Tax=unclassified Neptuniibacter TaxID=2630693 RepID=UPI0026E47D86|nr:MULTISPECIES: hypothetical protein [unclassified Neptuniibacter]MDO6513464.1 hypothetical protein [Neptuniibacter sp. 2_MG-2023]MDO6593993.1 hypothetical protein [Neptuniibacter sp. 1_MG-2023]
MSGNERIERDFNLRDEDEKKAFLEETWCDNCQEVNLGMKNPIEYEQNDIIFIEGKCCKCGNIILTEITEEEF